MPFLAYLIDLLTGSMPYLLLLFGLYFGVRLRFFPFRHPLRVAHALFAGGKASRTATCMALAGTVGVGNIAGVAIAITAGGAGAVLWMWLCALAAMLLKYAEITLTMADRVPDGHGGYTGGTPHSMRLCGMPLLGRLFAMLCLGYTLLIGGAVQANAASACLSLTHAVPPLCSGIALLLMTLPVILGGGKRISAMTARLVPLMCVTYLFACIVILLTHLDALPTALSSILQGAFCPAATSGGVLGFLSSRSLRIGAARGLMSNEGGCGTSPMAHATAKEVSPATQGLFGIFEVFVDTTVICTLSALAILTALPSLPQGAEGLSLVHLAFSSVFRRAGGTILTLLLFFFAYATVLCQAFYGQVCLSSLTQSKSARGVFFFAFCLSLLLGAIGAPAFIWQTCDILLALMTLANLTLLWKRREKIIALTRAGGWL